MKKCIKCNIEKDFHKFTKSKSSKDGFRNECKICKNDISRKLYQLNIQKERERNRNRNNNELVKESKRKWRENNREYSTKYYRKNSKKIQKRITERQKTDIIFALSNNIRKRINLSFRYYGYTKKSKCYEIIGCSFEFLKQYLESKFENWMNWDNRGKYNGEFNFGWDIDHIIPLSIAKTEDDIIRLNHYTNLQPLCSKINRDIKRNKKKTK